MGRCAVHATRSLAVSMMRHQRRVLCCCIHGWRGRPRGRFHCGLLLFGLRIVVGAVTSSCLDSQMQCHVGRIDFWKSSYCMQGGPKKRTPDTLDVSAFLDHHVYSPQRTRLKSSSLCQTAYSIIKNSSPKPARSITMTL